MAATDAASPSNLVVPDLASQLSNMQKTLLDNQKAVEERSRPHLVRLEPRLFSQVEDVQRGLVGVQREVKELSGVVDGHSQDIAQLSGRMRQLEMSNAEMQKRLSAESIEPVIKPNNHFDRTPNLVKRILMPSIGQCGGKS